MQKNLNKNCVLSKIFKINILESKKISQQSYAEITGSKIKMNYY